MRKRKRREINQNRWGYGKLQSEAKDGEDKNYGRDERIDRKRKAKQESNADTRGWASKSFFILSEATFPSLQITTRGSYTPTFHSCALNRKRERQGRREEIDR